MESTLTVEYGHKRDVTHGCKTFHSTGHQVGIHKYSQEFLTFTIWTGVMHSFNASVI